jgi:hypothetical protein
MDPVSAFGLAAAVLQVLHFSFEALGKCRELYQHGCLVENKSVQEITQDLGELLLHMPFPSLACIVVLSLRHISCHGEWVESVN